MTNLIRFRAALSAGIFCLSLWFSANLAPTPAHAQTVALPEANGWIWGIHYGIPLKWSLAVAAPLPGGYKTWKPFVAGEAGLGGWRASVGALTVETESGRGLVARATVLRATGKAWRATPGTTYAGPEIQLMPLFAIGARVGAFLRVGGNGNQRGLLAADVSFNF
jgi:hypothetical protein